MVTGLGYGAMELRNDARGRNVSEARAEKLLNSVLDYGINLIDTSIDYGMSEERIGRYISHRRSEFVLTTKCGCPLQVSAKPLDHAWALFRRQFRRSVPWRVLRRLASLRGATPSSEDRHSFTRENIIAGLEQSLRRMKTDYVDILQVHHAPRLAVLAELGTVETLLDLKKQGKIRFIGVSASLPVIADYTACAAVDVLQLPYSAFDREHETVLAGAAAAGIGTIVRSGGSVRGRNSRNPRVREAWRAVSQGGLFADMSPSELNIRFTAGHPDVHTLIVGSANPAHVRENVASLLKGPMSKEQISQVAGAFVGP